MLNPLTSLFILTTLVAPWAVASWLVRCFPTAARHRRGVIAVVWLVATLHWPMAWLSLRHASTWATLVHAADLFALVAMSLFAAPFAAASALLWLWHRLAGVPSQPLPDAGRRRILEAGAGVAVMGTAGAALGWGFVAGRHDYEVCEVPVRIPGLPRALDGYTITQLSDLHTGPFVNEAELDRSFAMVSRSKPDLICVTGDLVDSDARWAPLVATRLAALASRDGVFVVPGNHDYYAGWSAMARALRDAKLDVLVNQGRVVRAGDGGGFALLGVDDIAARDHGGRGPDLDAALSSVPRHLPRILLSHRPTTVEQWPGQVALQLSGHTHGGQINPANLIGSMALRYTAGLYSVQGTALYVNRGLGTSGPPSRVGSRPEITRIVLVSA